MWKFFIGAGLLATSTTMMAQNDKCGVASYIFKDKSMLSSAARYIINMTFFPTSTLGMSFGTSNCSKHSLVMIEKESLHIATMNYHDLMLQMASGHGEQMNAYAASLGCSAGAQQRFTQVMRGSYSTIFKSKETAPFEVVESTKTIIKKDPVLSAQCNLPHA